MPSRLDRYPEMSTSNGDLPNQPPGEQIQQEAGDQATLIGKVMGDLKIVYAIPAILVIAVLVIAIVLLSGVNVPTLVAMIAPSPTATITPALTITPIPLPTLTITPAPVPTIGKTKTPLVISPIPCYDCGTVVFAIATPVEPRTIKPATVIKLRQFQIDPTISDYEYSGRDYQVSEFKMSYLHKNGCEPEVTEFLPQMRAALQYMARQRGRLDLLPFIQTEDQIRVLRVERPEVVNELIPTTAEWQKMSLTTYEAMNQWLLHCIGIPWPAWTVTFENTSDQDQLITRVIYRITGRGSARGGEGGLVSPKATYIHQIDWIVGDQEVKLLRYFAIPAKANASFELQLTTAHPDSGMVWDMQIFFVIDEERGGVSTDSFGLIMSGLPAP